MQWKGVGFVFVLYDAIVVGKGDAILLMVAFKRNVTGFAVCFLVSGS